MTNEQKALLLSSAMQQYIFDKIFQKYNNGKVFDADAWLEDVDKIVSDNMFVISPEKQAELSNILQNLDNYAISDKNKSQDVHEKPKLVL